MNDSDKPAFAEAITGLAASLGTETNKAMLHGYWMALEDLAIEQVQMACVRAMRASKFFPRPVELRQLVGVMSPEDRAVQAWAAVRRAIGRHGSYRSVDFDDPVVNAVVRNLGGWEQLCCKPSEDFGVWVRKDFERIYCALVRGGVTSEAIAYLPGRTERENGGCDWGGRAALGPPAVVETGLPPHDRLPVRQIGAGPAAYEARQLVASLAEEKKLEE